MYLLHFFVNTTLSSAVFKHLISEHVHKLYFPRVYQQKKLSYIKNFIFDKNVSSVFNVLVK